MYATAEFSCMNVFQNIYFTIAVAHHCSTKLLHIASISAIYTCNTVTY